MKTTEFRQIQRTVSNVIELYADGSISKDQINNVFHKFSYSGPNSWQSRVFDVVIHKENITNNESETKLFLMEELGIHWASIIDLFVSSPGYLINTFCPDNQIIFDAELALKINVCISEAVDELDQIEKSGKEIIFEGSL